MEKESKPVFFVGEIAPIDDPRRRLQGRLGSDIGIDEAGTLFILHTLYRGSIDDVLRRLAEESILDLRSQPTTLLCDGNLLLQERVDSDPEKSNNGRRVTKITEEEIWDSKFFEQRRRRKERQDTYHDLGERKIQ
mgnify:CR=1 FL=1